MGFCRQLDSLCVVIDDETVLEEHSGNYAALGGVSRRVFFKGPRDPGPGQIFPVFVKLNYRCFISCRAFRVTQLV